MSQRIIKFRAWDKRFKRMIYASSMAILNLEDADHEIMQFTGLLDKNGKEIYEGDVVKNGENGNKYNGGIGVVEYALNNSEGHPINGYWASISEDEAFTIYPKEIEVIGNIYENPEFLKS